MFYAILTRTQNMKFVQANCKKGYIELNSTPRKKNPPNMHSVYLCYVNSSVARTFHMSQYKIRQCIKMSKEH